MVNTSFLPCHLGRNKGIRSRIPLCSRKTACLPELYPAFKGILTTKAP
jgi:hypothetical protein